MTGIINDTASEFSATYRLITYILIIMLLCHILVGLFGCNTPLIFIGFIIHDGP